MLRNTIHIGIIPHADAISGPQVMILKTFLPKQLTKKMVLFTQNRASSVLMMQCTSTHLLPTIIITTYKLTYFLKGIFA
jgi:hypothetical protein